MWTTVYLWKAWDSRISNMTFPCVMNVLKAMKVMAHGKWRIIKHNVGASRGPLGAIFIIIICFSWQMQWCLPFSALEVFRVSLKGIVCHRLHLVSLCKRPQNPLSSVNQLVLPTRQPEKHEITCPTHMAAQPYFILIWPNFDQPYLGFKNRSIENHCILRKLRTYPG